MENLFSSFLSFFNLTFSAIGPFLLLLAVLIFIHELGHFLAARWCGVQVEVFSLGFGPKIFQYKKGETVYCISALPFGGYVKMLGDNPLKPLPEAEQHKGFLYKKVPQKLAIAFGGPLMNLLFTIGAFWYLFVSGIPALSPTLGDVPENSAAYKKGLRPGDTVQAINGNPIHFLKDAQDKIQEGYSQTLKMNLLSSSGELKTISFKPEKKSNKNPLELKKQIGHIEGFTFASTGTRVGIPSPNSPAFLAGLRTFDEITEIQGEKIKYWRDLNPLIASLATEKKLHLTVKREVKGPNKKQASKEKSLSIPLSASLSPNLKNLGIEKPDLYIQKVGKGTPAEKSGLKKGDRVLSIEGNKIKNWREFSETIQNTKSGKPLRFTILRAGGEKTLSVQPERMFTENAIQERVMVGIISGSHLAFPEEKLKRLSVFAGGAAAMERTFHWLKIMTVNFAQLATGTISYRHLSGPVGIGRVAHQSFKEGWSAFIRMMAFISLSLFFINLLPVPLLDGGHILFFSIEGILGRPLDLKKLILAQQIGLVTLLSFFAFVFVNDIYKWLTAW